MKPDVTLIPNRPPVVIEGRYVPKGRRDQVRSEQGDVCARSWCEGPIAEVDHIKPLWLGGSNRRENLEGLCADCHRQKTGAEAGLRAKARKLAGETGNGPKRQIPNKGFGPRSRKMNGQIGLTQKAARAARSPETDHA